LEHCEATKEMQLQALKSQELVSTVSTAEVIHIYFCVAKTYLQCPKCYSFARKINAVYLAFPQFIGLKNWHGFAAFINRLACGSKRVNFCFHISMKNKPSVPPTVQTFCWFYGEYQNVFQLALKRTLSLEEYLFDYFAFEETNYWNTDMCTSESWHIYKIIAQSADSLETYSKPRPLNSIFHI